MEYRLKKLSPEQQEEAGLAERYTIAAPGAEPDAEAELVPPPISTLSRLIGGWRYVIETDEWHDADDTRTETRAGTLAGSRRVFFFAPSTGTSVPAR